MVKSVICEMLGIEYPVFQGGMAWISDGKLAAGAVAKCNSSFFVSKKEKQAPKNPPIMV